MYFKSHISIDPINAALAKPDDFCVSSWPSRILVAFKRSRELEANLSFPLFSSWRHFATRSWFLPHRLTLFIFPAQLLTPKFDSPTVACRDAPLVLRFLVFQIPSGHPGSALVLLSTASGQASWRRSLPWYFRASGIWTSRSHVLLVRRCQEEHGKELALQRAQQETVGMERSKNGKGKPLQNQTGSSMDGQHPQPTTQPPPARNQAPGGT